MEQVFKEHGTAVISMIIVVIILAVLFFDTSSIVNVFKLSDAKTDIVGGEAVNDPHGEDNGIQGKYIEKEKPIVVFADSTEPEWGNMQVGKEADLSKIIKVTVANNPPGVTVKWKILSCTLEDGIGSSEEITIDNDNKVKFEKAGKYIFTVYAKTGQNRTIKTSISTTVN